jgi:multiple sugar transport system permease protein
VLNTEGDPLTTTWSLYLVAILAEVWKTTPFMALLLLAGLSQVSDELHEAARVDGASAWQRFWKITVPLIKPAILVAVLFRTLDAFRIFDTIYVLTASTQNRSIETVSNLGYNSLLTQLNLGVGSAISVLIFLMVGLIAFVFIKLLGTNVQQGD